MLNKLCTETMALAALHDAEAVAAVAAAVAAVAFVTFCILVHCYKIGFLAWVN